MLSRTRVSFASVLVLALIWPLSGTTAQSPGRHPVSGREIAAVMGWQGAAWLERPERAAEEEPERALDAMAIEPGMTVADIGAGTGYFTVRLSQRVGPDGHVYANDLQPQMQDLLRARLLRESITNVTLVRGAVDDPRLPDGTLDLVLMVDVYHEFSQPQAMLRRVRRALKAEGRLVLLEYRKEDPSIPIRPEHKMSVDEARIELEAEGYVLARVDRRLPRQHVLIFKKRG